MSQTVRAFPAAPQISTIVAAGKDAATSLSSWLHQPTTIHGIAAVVTTIGAAVTAWSSGQITGVQAIVGLVGGMSYGLVHMLMPDNSTAARATQVLIQDTLTASFQGQEQFHAAMPVIMKDAVATVAAIETGAKS